MARDQPWQQEDGDQRADVRDRVEEVDPLQLHELQEDAGDRRPADGAELRRDAVQRGGRKEVVLVDELRRHRALRSDADAERGRDDQLRRVERPHVWVGERGVDREPEAADDHPDLLHLHQAAQVDGVGNRATDHGE